MVTHYLPVDLFYKHYHNPDITIPAEYGITLAFKYIHTHKKPIYVETIYPKKNLI
jgi:hypothetical protein